MDPASFALSVLPVVVGALKAYCIVHRKCRQFCEYSRDVKRLQKKIRQQKQLFKTECELLLRSALQGRSDMVGKMLEDTTDHRWQDASLDTRMLDTLKDNLQCCIETIEGIQETLEELQNGLRVFDQLGDYRVKDEPIKHTIRRLRGAIIVTFKSADYEDWLDDLHHQNEILCRLRGYTETFEASPRAEQGLVGKKWPRSLLGIRNASEKLHDTLTRRNEPMISSITTLRLCLETQEIGETICLDLVICNDTSNGSRQGRPYSSSLQLGQFTVETVDLGDDHGTEHGLKLVKLQNSTTGLERACASASSSQATPAKHRKVHFVDDLSISDESAGTKTISISSVHVQSISTQDYQNIYQQLLAKVCSTHISTKRCPGLFETTNGHYKHVFHSSLDCSMKTCCQPLVPRPAQVLTLHDALGKPVEESVEMIEQLQLAQRLVLGVVQFYGTSWLGDNWGSRDVAVFSCDGEISASALRTLHCTKPSVATTAPGQNAMDGVEFVPTITPSGVQAGSNLSCYGILNAVMYHLGLHLIRIAYWSPLDNLDVPRARELLDPSMRRPPLGRRYQELARKCLECDFGFGKDLKRPALLNAIHTDVVSVLDKLIDSVAALNLSDD